MPDHLVFIWLVQQTSIDSSLKHTHTHTKTMLSSLLKRQQHFKIVVVLFLDEWLMLELLYEDRPGPL